MIAKVPTIKAHNIWLTSGDETRRKAAIEFVTKGLQAHVDWSKPSNTVE